MSLYEDALTPFSSFLPTYDISTEKWVHGDYSQGPLPDSVLAPLLEAGFETQLAGRVQEWLREGWDYGVNGYQIIHLNPGDLPILDNEGSSDAYTVGESGDDICHILKSRRVFVPLFNLVSNFDLKERLPAFFRESLARSLVDLYKKIWTRMCNLGEYAKKDYDRICVVSKPLILKVYADQDKNRCNFILFTSLGLVVKRGSQDTSIISSQDSGTGLLLGLERALLLECLRRVGAVRVGRFVLASGREAPYYVDVRRATLDSEGARLVGKAVARAVEGRPEVQAVGGLTLGADPIVGATLAQVTRPLAGFLVRARAKDHGTRCQIEGPLEPGMTVAIVDDVATTGGSILQVVDAVAVLGCRVAGVYVVMDRLEGAREALAARGIALEALLTVRDLGLEPQVLSV